MIKEVRLTNDVSSIAANAISFNLFPELAPAAWRLNCPDSVGSVGDSYDNALAETINGLYKAEVIHKNGPW